MYVSFPGINKTVTFEKIMVFITRIIALTELTFTLTFLNIIVPAFLNG